MHDLLWKIITQLQGKVNHKEACQALISLIQKWLNKDDGLPELAPNPNGFYVARLYTNDDGRNIRLHIWPRVGRWLQDERLMIHDHVYSLRSLVLCGRLMNEYFHVEQINDHATYRFYEVKYDKHSSWLEGTQTSVKIRKYRTVEYDLGTVYTIDSDTFHLARVSADMLTATLVLTSSPLNKAPSVVGPSDYPHKIVFERRGVESKSTRKLLTELLLELTNKCSDK